MEDVKNTPSTEKKFNSVIDEMEEYKGKVLEALRPLQDEINEILNQKLTPIIEQYNKCYVYRIVPHIDTNIWELQICMDSRDFK